MTFACFCRYAFASPQYLLSATLWVQGMQLGLQTLAAAGAMTVVTLQGGKRKVSCFEVERDKAGDMTNQPAFDSYLRGMRKTGALRSKAEEAVSDGQQTDQPARLWEVSLSC